MTNRHLLRRAFLGTVACGLIGLNLPVAAQSQGAAPSPHAAAPRPNIVVILADDMGFSDIGSYGSEIPTPNLDALAASGLRFTQFYNAARCSPTRASLLTGLYPHQAGMGNLDSVIVPSSRGLHGRLLDRAVTIPQVLKGAGYFTAMSGKWHVGQRNGTPPATKGFDRSFLFPGSTYYKDQRPKAMVTIDGRDVPITSPEVGSGYWYASDLLVDWGIKFTREATAKKQPFFLYLPFTAPHFPVMAPKEDVARFKDAYRAGWEKLREARLARQKTLGIIDADTKLAPLLRENYDWDSLSQENKDRFSQIMAVYAASISRMDKAIGTLVAELKARGQFDNTLILFMSDNGGNAESGPDGRLRGQNPGGARSDVWVGLNWATLQNTPFSYYKHYGEEGGVASPLIAHWPKGIGARLNGTLVRAPSHLIDIMPTLVELAGASYPREYNGNAILPMEGRSIAASFSGAALTRSVPLFFEHEGNRSVRDGRWKLVGQFNTRWSLYDMDADRSETHDVAAQHPDLVKKMSAQWDAWAARAFVDRWPRKDAGGVTPGMLEGGPVRPQSGMPGVPSRRGRRAGGGEQE